MVLVCHCFFSKFLEDISSFLWGYWYSCLESSDDVYPEFFKARLDHSLACFVACPPTLDSSDSLLV